jgi:predicted DNA-binding transcriptional regulator AlpA
VVGRLLPWAEVARLTSLSRRTAKRLAARGEFPSERSIPGGSRKAWVESEVLLWVKARIES